MALVLVTIVADVADEMMDGITDSFKYLVNAEMQDEKMYDATMVVLKGDGERVNLQEG